MTVQNVRKQDTIKVHFKKSLFQKTIFMMATLLIPLVGHAVVEKHETYLFTCPISVSQRHEQIVIKDVRVGEVHGGFQYFVLDVEAGNQNGAVNGEGQHLKYIQTLLTSQNATSDIFYRTHGDHFQFDFEFEGHYRNSSVKLFLDKSANGKYVLSLNGGGPLFYDLRNEYQDVLAESEFYGHNWRVECFVHPHIDSFLSL